MNLYSQIESHIPTCAQEQQDKKRMLQYLDTGSDLLMRSNETAHFTASAWVMDERRERVLMAYHNLYRSWAWLGGHADGEEDLCAVAARELREESGLTSFRIVTKKPISLEILQVAAHEKRGRPVPAHLHLNLTYLFEADPAADIFCKKDENSAVGWLTAQEVAQKVTEPQMLPIYRKLFLCSRNYL